MTPPIPDAPAPETLRFGDVDTALGIVMVAMSAHGVVALLIGNDRETLLHDLKGHFRQAEFVPDQKGLARPRRWSMRPTSGPT